MEIKQHAVQQLQGQKNKNKKKKSQGNNFKYYQLNKTKHTIQKLMS